MTKERLYMDPATDEELKRFVEFLQTSDCRATGVGRMFDYITGAIFELQDRRHNERLAHEPAVTKTMAQRLREAAAQGQDISGIHCDLEIEAAAEFEKLLTLLRSAYRALDDGEFHDLRNRIEVVLTGLPVEPPAIHPQTNMCLGCQRPVYECICEQLLAENRGAGKA